MARATMIMAAARVRPTCSCATARAGPSRPSSRRRMVRSPTTSAPRSRSRATPPWWGCSTTTIGAPRPVLPTCSRAAARDAGGAVRGQEPARRLSLHVRPGVGGRMQELLVLGRQLQRHRRAPEPPRRDHDRDLPRTAGQADRLRSAARLELRVGVLVRRAVARSAWRRAVARSAQGQSQPATAARRAQRPLRGAARTTHLQRATVRASTIPPQVALVARASP